MDRILPTYGRDDPERQSQMVQAFNVYRTATLLDVLDRPQTFAFVDGVVVASEARVVSADPCGLVLRVDPQQVAALERTGSVLIESPLHGATYRAGVEGVEPRKHFVSLGGLETFDAYRERRGFSRAAPRHPMLARVSVGVRDASGRVVDLSPRALAVDFDRERFAPLADEPVLRLEVWGEQQERRRLRDFVTTARVSRSAPRENGKGAALRAVLEIDAYPALDRLLRHYVARRQREILTELRLAGPQRCAAIA